MTDKNSVPMNYQTIQSSLREFLSDQVLAEGVEVDEDSILSELGVDSFSLMELLLFFEREFAVSLPMEELTPDNIRSVRALSECIVKLVREKGACS